MKKLAFVIVPALVLFASLAWATTYTTPVIDGIIGTDWDADEQFETETFNHRITGFPADYTLWITWDEFTGIYIGIDRVVDADNMFLCDGECISLYVAIDTDQTPGSGGTYDGYSSAEFCGNHLPEYFYAFAGGEGWYEWAIWDQVNGWWNFIGWRNDGTYYGWDNDVNIDDEVTILWSDIGNPEGVAVKVWLTYEFYDPWPPEVVASWPPRNDVGIFPPMPWSYEFYYGHYYCAPGVPAYCNQPACNIVPNITDISIPVTLSSFTAVSRGGAIEVGWTSQTEVDARAYYLLRSEEAEGQYVEVYRCDASGNSEIPRDYRYVDREVVEGQTYYYQLVDVDNEGNKTYHGPVFASAGASLPGTYSLLPNYPNPFNPSTAIGYDIPKASNVTLTIYNVLGQELRTLMDARQEAGSYTVMWDSKDDAGQHLNSGVYFCTLRAGDFTQTRKMILMR